MGLLEFKPDYVLVIIFDFIKLPAKREHTSALTSWFQPVYMDEDGWVESKSEILVPALVCYKFIEIIFEFPGWMGKNLFCVNVGLQGKFVYAYQLNPGYYSLTLPISPGPSGTRVSLQCDVKGSLADGRGERSFLIVSTGYRNQAALHRIGSMIKCDENKLDNDKSVSIANTLYQALTKFALPMLINSEKNESIGSILVKKGSFKFRSQPLREIFDTQHDECFLVASGPSINQVDFDKIQGKTVLGVNGAASLLEQYPGLFSYYVVVDPYVAIYKINLLRTAIQSGAICLFSLEVILIVCATCPDLLAYQTIFLIELDFISYADMKADNDYTVAESDQGDGAGFGKNLAKPLPPIGTVAFVSLQICYYLGFSKVFALGMDFRAEKQRYRFYEGENDALMRSVYTENLDRTFESDILPAFKALGLLVLEDQSRFQVFNLCNSSRLSGTLMPKISLEEALSMTATRKKLWQQK